jgi:hypothetical protein
MTGLLASVLVLAAQDPSTQLVTANPRLGRLPVVLQELSGSAGMKLDCIPLYENEVVYVEITNMPREELLARIARAVSGRWDPVGEGKRLVPDPVAWQTEERAYADDRTKKLRQIVDSGRSVNGAFGLGAPPAEFGDAQEKPAKPTVPEIQPVGAIMRMLDLRRIALMRGNERVVYSTHPTRMQYPLPDAARGVINAWVARHNRNASAESAMPDVPPDEVAAFLPAGMIDRMRRMAQPVRAWTKANLSVGGSGNFMMGQVAKLDLYDSEGNALITESLPIGGGMFGELFGAVAGAFASPTGEQTGEEDSGIDDSFKLSDEAKEYESASRNAFAFGRAALQANGEGEPKKTSERMLTMLMQPHLYDPLSFGSAERLQQSMPKDRKSLIACLDDAIGTSTAESKREFLNAFERLHKVERKDGHIFVKPTLPHAARLNRENRVAYAELFLATQESETIGLEPLSRFAAKVPMPNQSGPLHSIVARKVPSMNSILSIFGSSQWPLLTWYGSLDAGTQARLRSGQPIQLGSFPIAATRTLLYGPGIDITQGESQDLFSMFMGTFTAMFGASSVQEPTELMPNGVPPQGTVVCVVSPQPFLAPAKEDAKSFGGIGYLGLDELGIFEMTKSTEEGQKAIANESFPGKVRIGQRTVLNLRFNIAPGRYVYGTLSDDVLSKNARVVPFNQLPSDILGAARERAEQMKKSPFGRIMEMRGMGVGGPPPN